MGNYLDMVGELMGEVPGLPQPVALRLFNKGWEDVRNERLWSWQIEQGEVYSPDQITTGLASVVQYSASVQFDTAARVALDAQSLAAQPPLIPRQFRVSMGPIYTLSGYDTLTGIGTLDRVYAEATNATSSYLVYKCYYTPPFVDHLRYISILDPINGFAITGPALLGTRDQIDRMDPMRGSQGDPYRLYGYKKDDDGLTQHEFWPQPIVARAFICSCVRRGLDLTDPEDTLPSTLNSNLVITKALYYCYKWALSHAGTAAELKGINWLALMTDAQNKYKMDLVGAKREDNEILLTNVTKWHVPNPGFLGPVDSNWSQSHGVPGF